MHALRQALNLCSGSLLGCFIHPVQLMQPKVQGVLYVLYQLLYLKGDHIHIERNTKGSENRSSQSVSHLKFCRWWTKNSFGHFKWKIYVFVDFSPTFVVPLLQFLMSVVCNVNSHHPVCNYHRPYLQLKHTTSHKSFNHHRISISFQK